MLEYEWSNPTEEQDSSVARHIDNYDDHYTFNNHHHLLSHSHPNNPSASSFPLPHHHFIPPPQIHNLNSIFDQRAPYAYPPPNPSSLLLLPKTEDASLFPAGSRIGLNLGGRTYFSSSEDDFVNRLYRRSKPALDPASPSSPRCQAQGCAADLTHAKHYHRRHKVCEFHSKASTVIAAGLTQRFCQQCSRFHLLSEFDNGKRSCRKRLADHNRRRRKSHLSTNENQKSPIDSARNLSSDNLASSPPDSGTHSSSSVTVAISPPRMSLECCFHPRQYGAGPNSIAAASSSSSLFFSTG